MRPSPRLLPFALLIAIPGVAWAEGNAIVLPMVANGVDSKVSNNLTSLLSSELDFSGAFDTVNDIPAPASLNASCLTSTKCLAGIAKDNDANAVVAGSVSTGSAGLKVSLVLYDAGKNAIVRKKSYDIASDVASVAGAAPKMAKELLGEGGAAAAAEEAGPSADSFADEEDFAFDKSSDVKGKTKFTPETKKGKLVDTADEEEDLEAERAAAEAATRRAEAEAKLKAEARAKAEAEAAARAEAEKAAKARAEAEAKAKAKAAAEAKAKAEAEEEAKAAAKAAAARKSAPVEEPTDEDLEAELAAFSFGGGGKVAADAEPEEEEAAPRSFSERYGSSSGSKSTKPAESKASSKTTASRARVEEVEEEPDEEIEEEEEEAPRATSRTSSSREAAEEPDEDEEEVAPSRRTSRDEEEEEDLDGGSRSRASTTASRRVVEEEEEPPARSRSRLDEEEEPIRRAGNEDASAKFGVAVRGGYARYGSLDFVTYGAELDIPVANRVLLLLGVEGASTNRNYTDDERAVIASAAGILPEQVQDWNAILPINFGVVYKVPTTAIQPYIGLDGLAVAYTATPDFAFGARLRGGCDFMVSENFGFNLDVGLGVLSGEQFDLIQAGLADTGFYPEVSGGTVLSF